MPDQFPLPLKQQVPSSAGCEWFGEVPQSWIQLPLCSIAKIKSIANQKDEDLLSVYLELGVVKFDDIDEKRTNATSADLSSYQLVEAGDFVMNNQQAWRGSVGVSKFRGIVSPAYLVFELDKRLDSRFANYLFRDSSMVSQYLISSKGVGTIQRNLYWAHLKRAVVYMPPISEQVAIANFLDGRTVQIYQAIQIKERQIERLKERKQILIQQAVTRGLDPHAPMRDSGIEWVGEIPAHWSINRAKYIFREVDERSPDGQQELLSVSHLTGVTPRSEKNVTMFMSEDYTGSKVCRKDDLVFNIMWAWMGALGVSDRAGIVSSAYGIYRQLQAGTLNPQYLEMLLKTTAYIAHYNKVSTGLHSSRLRFYGHMFMAMEIGFPDREEQDAIVAYLELESGKLNKAVDLLEQQITKLKEYKATLINSAVTGKIKVPGVVEPVTPDMEVA
jgi:type I restriction enzyme S subunit